jgi:tRNA threonylcarbamoyladenosine biosynthesis protein TsaB
VPPVQGLVLGIETATALGGVAIVDGQGRILCECSFLGRESHAERIIPEVSRLVASLGAGPQDLAAVAVSAGPGSFTGLRSGVASAKGLAFARGIPLYGVSTLEALAANAPAGSGTVCAVLGARRGEVYRALFEAGSPGPVRLTPDELVPADGFAAALPTGCLVLGDPPAAGAARLRGDSLRYGPAHLNHPRPATVALYGWAALQSAQPSRLADLLPRYVRPPGAEVSAGWCASGKPTQ